MGGVGSPAVTTPILSGVPPIPVSSILSWKFTQLPSGWRDLCCPATPWLPWEPRPRQYVTEEEKDYFILSSDPLFCVSGELLALFPGVELGRVAIFLASRGPSGSRPAFSTTCFQMLPQCIWVTREARELALSPPEGRGCWTRAAGSSGSSRGHCCQEKREQAVPCWAADLLWSRSRLAARPYKDGSTEWGKRLFPLQAKPKPLQY